MTSASRSGRSGRPLLIGAGIAVALAAVVLVWQLRGTSEPDPAAVVGQGSERTLPRRTSGLDPVRIPPSVSDGSGSSGSTGSAERPEVKEYEVDGKLIRDHRKGNHPPIDLPPNFHPPESRRVNPLVTRDISDRMREVIRECTAAVPPEARGARPRAEGQVVIAIAATKVSITKATFQLRDVVGAAVDPVQTCIEQKAIAVTATAADEPDLKEYSINLTLAVR